MSLFSSVRVRAVPSDVYEYSLKMGNVIQLSTGSEDVFFNLSYGEGGEDARDIASFAHFLSQSGCCDVKIVTPPTEDELMQLVADSGFEEELSKALSSFEQERALEDYIETLDPQESVPLLDEEMMDSFSEDEVLVISPCA